MDKAPWKDYYLCPLDCRFLNDDGCEIDNRFQVGQVIDDYSSPIIPGEEPKNLCPFYERID